MSFKQRKYLFFLASFSLNAQNILVSGKITVSDKKPLAYANILAIPEDGNQDIRFAITELDGSYKLSLEKNQTYNITVSYLGYKSQTIEILTKGGDIAKNFALLENPDQLDEVTLNYSPPISVKKDTITYNVDSFKSGEERKLREVLKNYQALK